jgi:putative ABC transport system permease protein
VFWRPSVADEVDEELEFHLGMVVRELTERGHTPEAARAEALRRFGDFAEVRARCRSLGEAREREERRTEYLTELRQDVRLALRQLRNAPAFTAVAVLTLVLAIGANTAIFSAVSAVLLRPLPYPAADRLTLVWQGFGDSRRTLLTYPDLIEYRARNRTLEDIGIARTQSVNLTGGERPDRMVGCFVTANTLRLLGARAERGRLFSDVETSVGTGARVAVLSHAAWSARYGSDPRIVGRTLTLNGLPHVVIGVTTADYQDPFGPPEVWLPVTSAPNPDWLTRANASWWGLARLRPDVTPAQAQDDMARVSAAIAADFPAGNTGSVTLEPLRDFIVGKVRPALLILLGFVALILLIGCANIANLQLARATARRRELSLRAALGARRGRLVRQLVTESMVLALIGGTIGVLLARWGIAALVASVPDGLPVYGEVGLDLTVLAFSIAITVGAGLLFGAVPARYGTRTDVADALQGRGGETGSGGVRQLVVAGQLALCIVLLVGSVLLLRSFAKVQAQPTGFDVDRLLTAELRLPTAKYGNDTVIAQFADQALERLRALPGVESAALLGSVPLSGNWGMTNYLPEGAPTPADSALPTTQYNPVSDGFFGTMGIPLLAGRDFTTADRLGTPLVAIVNQELARQAWPGESPLGKRIRIVGPPDTVATVVGIAGNVKQLTLTDAAEPQLYVAKAQNPGIFSSIALRTRGNPERMQDALLGVIWSVDRDQPVWKVRTMASLLDRDLSLRRFTARLTGGFALVALLLAMIGVYGVMTYVVAQRTREIGIRMALGAARGAVVRMVLGRGLRVVAAGTVLGLAGAYAGARLIARQLYGVPPTDLATFVIVPFVLAAVATLACWLPARRAARVDPVSALSVE